jgi:hypothetical protein
MERYVEILSPYTKLPEQFKHIDPVEFRRELAKLFQSEGKFQMCKMDDPVEVLFGILNAFHSYSSNANSLKYIIDKPCNPPCLAHTLFWINILEQFECQCGATSEILQYDYNYFVYEAYVREIMNYISNQNDVLSYSGSFFKYVKANNVNISLMYLVCHDE